MSVASTPRWRRVAQDALVCVLVLLLVVLVATNYEAEPVFTARPATHRFVKRDGGATAGIVVGALIFFGLIGFAWISCQHPHWNLCKCCCKCCDNTEDADGRQTRGSWFRREDKAQTDLEMAQVESVMSRFEEEAAEKALAHRRGASYETREMRVPHEGERAGRSSHDRIRSTTRMDGHDVDATRGKTKRVENWLKDQTQVHGGGQSQDRSPRPSMDSIELRQPRPVQIGHSQGPSVSRLQGDAMRLEASHNRQPSQASLHPGDHLAVNYQSNHPQHPTHSRSGSAASARSRSPSPMRSPGKLHKPLPAAPSDETAQR